MIDIAVKVIDKIKARRKAKADARNLDRVARDLLTVLPQAGPIPVLVVSYNNGVYVQHTVDQLQRFGIRPIIIDNDSSDEDSRQILSALAASQAAHVVYARANYGNMVGFKAQIYEALPQYFAYTDPDLLYRDCLPADFMNVLQALSNEYQCYKVGMALSLEHDGELAQTANRFTLRIPGPIRFEKSYSVQEWERSYWLQKIEHPSLELYSAPIDTTFALYNKEMFRGSYMFPSIRVGGAFEVLHMPWFKNLDIMKAAERERYLQGNRSATWAR